MTAQPLESAVADRQRRWRLSDESGYVAIFVALCLPLLVGMCALAVDVATWQVTGTKVQKAADAAALGGSVYLPDDQPTAYAVAVDLAAKNGYSAANGDTITTQRTTRPGQLRVTITTTVNNAFGVIFGQQQTKITRTSVADYAGPVPMGSPCNVFGNEPPPQPGQSNKASSVCTTNELWLNIAGPTSSKVSGDRHQANLCPNSIYGCSGGHNDEYSTAGYFYIVKVRQAGQVAVEAFDPAFVSVNDHCDSANLNGATGIPAGKTAVGDPATRYAKGDGVYCTGDMLFTGDAEPALPPTTSFIVRGPYDGADPQASPALSGCTKQFKGFGTEGQSLTLSNLLNTDNGSADARLLQAEFRRWVNLCTFNAPGPGDYVIQILTNVPLGADPTNPASRNPNLGGSGHNRMALRASYTSGANNAPISVSGLQSMSVYANATNFNTNFFLARVNSGGEDHILTVILYDIGDASNAGTLQVLPPVEATVNGSPLSTFAGCQLTAGSSTTKTNLTSCLESVAVQEYNGTIAKITVPIPDGYRCDDADPAGCWVRIKYAFPGGIQDTTTWTASLDGDPVRIVE